MQNSGNIKLLNHKQENIAAQIYSIFQESYKVESELIGAKDFPPLSRATKDIVLSTSTFWGLSDRDGLIGVIEVEQQSSIVQISSLAISPRAFRQGGGASLVSFVLTALNWQTA